MKALPLRILERQARRLHREAHVYYFAFRHPGVRWHARLLAACTVAYLLSPVQLIPSFIPFIGFLDDALVLFLGVKLLQRIIPAEVLTECRRLAEAAEIREKDKIQSTAAVITSITVVSLWLLAAIATCALTVRFIRR